LDVLEDRCLLSTGLAALLVPLAPVTGPAHVGVPSKIALSPQVDLGPAHRGLAAKTPANPAATSTAGGTSIEHAFAILSARAGPGLAASPAPTLPKDLGSRAFAPPALPELLQVAAREKRPDIPVYSGPGARDPNAATPAETHPTKTPEDQTEPGPPGKTPTDLADPAPDKAPPARTPPLRLTRTAVKQAQWEAVDAVFEEMPTEVCLAERDKDGFIQAKVDDGQAEEETETSPVWAAAVAVAFINCPELRAEPDDKHHTLNPDW
jgi:hypothetical protein